MLKHMELTIDKLYSFLIKYIWGISNTWGFVKRKFYMQLWLYA